MYHFQKTEGRISSEIEKGNLIDNSDSMTNQGGVNHLPFNNYDERLLRIYQSPQRKFLNENYEPTPETVQRVRNGNLFITFYE